MKTLTALCFETCRCKRQKLNSNDHLFTYVYLRRGGEFKRQHVFKIKNSCRLLSVGWCNELMSCRHMQICFVMQSSASKTWGLGSCVSVLEIRGLISLWGKYQAANLSQCTDCRKGNIAAFCPSRLPSILLSQAIASYPVSGNTLQWLTQELQTDSRTLCKALFQADLLLTFRHMSLSPKLMWDCVNISTFVQEINILLVLLIEKRQKAWPHELYRTSAWKLHEFTGRLEAWRRKSCLKHDEYSVVCLR